MTVPTILLYRRTYSTIDLTKSRFKYNFEILYRRSEKSRLSSETDSKPVDGGTPVLTGHLILPGRTRRPKQRSPTGSSEKITIILLMSNFEDMSPY